MYGRQECYNRDDIFIEFLKLFSKADLCAFIVLGESCTYLYLFCYRLFKHVGQFLQDEVFVVSQRCKQHLQIILRRKATGRYVGTTMTHIFRNYTHQHLNILPGLIPGPNVNNIILEGSSPFNKMS